MWRPIVKRCLGQFVTLGSMFVLAACGQSAPSERGSTGAAGEALQISPGVTVSSASYRVTGPNGFSSAGNVPVGDSADVSVSLSGLPADTGFDIDLAATASDGMTLCEGESMFDAPSGGRATVVVHLTCGIPSGQVQVTATTNVCPVLDALEALPAEVRVGGHMSLSATAHDSDNGPSPLSYKWSSNGRALNGQTQPTLTFTCTTAGNVMIQVAASDGDATCTDSASAMLMCSP